jgi:hypothetical protein
MSDKTSSKNFCTSRLYLKPLIRPKTIELSKRFEKSEISLSEDISSYNNCVNKKSNSSEYDLEDNILLKKLFVIKNTNDELCTSFSSALDIILYINLDMYAII